MSWSYAEASGPAGQLHAVSAARVAQPGVDREAVRVVATTPAVVLGSAEPAGHLDPEALAAAGLEMARRRSGGAAVMVGPDRCLWVDLVIPRDDPLWSEDVGRAAWWVGECWASALAAIGVGGTVVHEGAMVRSEWSDRACFAGLGPGEVTVGGRKVVGVAQRRTRFGALFQCAVPLDAPPDSAAQLAAVQAITPAERRAMAADLAAQTLVLPPEQASPLLRALRSALPPS